MERQAFIPGATWPGSGINYGNDRAFPQYFNQTAIVNELHYLRKYFHKLRVFIPHYQYTVSSSVIRNCLYIIDQARLLGFTDIVWGSTCSEAVLTAASYSSYVGLTLSRASLAAAHGVTTFVVGNEEEYHTDNTTLSAGQIQSHIRSDLADAVRPVFSGTLSYNAPAGALSSWLAAGKGNLDNLGLNVYGSSEYDGAGFCRDVRNLYNAFGPTAYISEYGISFNWPEVTMSDEEQYYELRKRHDFVRNIGLSSGYFFLYTHLSDDFFGVRLADGQYRSMWKALVRERFAWTGLPNRAAYTQRRPRLGP